jgi:hypothetical protein
MKDQVTSIEQSKRLIELGVPAEKASMVWQMDEDCARLKIWNTDKETRRWMHNKYPNYYVPAFTVADLLEVLPKAIWDDVKGWSLLVIRFRSKGFPRVGYEAEHGIIWSCGEVSLLGNIIETIDWVVTNGYGLDT